MIPIMLDPTKLSVGLVGRGELTVSRLAWLKDGGATPVVFSDCPDSHLSAVASGGLVRRLPTSHDLLGLHVLWIADLPEDDAMPLVRMARQARLLINWEDRKPACDFHNPALVRRGDLLLSIATGGKSPGLASRLRRMFERMFGPEWQDRLDELADERLGWKNQTTELDELARLTDEHIDARGWLTSEPETADVKGSPQ